MSLILPGSGESGSVVPVGECLTARAGGASWRGTYRLLGYAIDKGWKLELWKSTCGYLGCTSQLPGVLGLILLSLYSLYR